MTKDNRRAASPVQAGIDPLVAEIAERLESHMGKQTVPVLLQECRAAADFIRSQADRIATLEVERDQWEHACRASMADAEPAVRRSLAAESLLAEAREALEQISAGPMFAVTDVKRWAEWVADLARATLSRLKQGEKGGGDV